MKIGILCFPTPGGSGVVATELGKELSRRGHEIHIIAYETPFRLENTDHIHFHQVNLREYPLFPHPFLTIEITAKLVEVLDRYSLDIIHVHYALPNALSAVLAREIAGKVRIVTTVHGTDVTVWGKEPSLQPVIRYGLEQSDAVSAVSHDLKNEVYSSFGLDKGVQVIPNFVDTRAFSRLPDSSLRSQLARDGEKIILHVSNFRPVKRLQDLITAFFRLQRCNPGTRLVLAGDGAEREPAEKLVHDLGLASQVIFLGTRAELVQLYSAADLFVLPSEKESFGLSALEAMACRVPVVATETGGLPEVVEHGKTGLLVPVGDTEALSASIATLLGNPILHAQMAARSREKAEKFSPENIVPQYEAFYQRVFSALGLQGSTGNPTG